MTTLLTLALDPDAQAHFEALRRQHYPAALNRIPAHVSLFHQLPGSGDTASVLRAVAADTPGFEVRVSGVRSLGKGVAYTLQSTELLSVHRRLAEEFGPDLITQDRQRFQPHVVVQNKVAPEQARTLLAALQASFTQSSAQATGLLWWEYLGGPWKLLEHFAFAGL